MEPENKILYGVGCFAILLALIIFLIGLPFYNVWSMEMNGKAQLAEAEWNRQIKIEEAKANLEAEKMNAQAEVERAKGMAEAIKIENNGLTKEYIQYLWVKNLADNKNVIYVPTETNLPILEAGKRLEKENK